MKQLKDRHLSSCEIESAKRRELSMKKNVKLQSFITIGMLSSISFLLMLFNFPIPPFPAFLEVDFSDMPALLAAITMGPVAGILVELF